MRPSIRIATLLVTSAAVLLTSCRGPLPENTLPMACTQIGCESTVEFELPDSIREDRSYEIEACADTFCRSETVDIPRGFTGRQLGELSVELERILLILPEADYAGRHRVSLVVRDAESGEVLAQAEHDVEFERRQPNGPNCPPVCWFARVAA
ncbi:MAG: hypothetical protein ACRDXD_07240 [Acidimicrobiia bacterium]